MSRLTATVFVACFFSLAYFLSADPLEDYPESDKSDKESVL